MGNERFCSMTRIYQRYGFSGVNSFSISLCVPSNHPLYICPIRPAIFKCHRWSKLAVTMTNSDWWLVANVVLIHNSVRSSFNAQHGFFHVFIALYATFHSNKFHIKIIVSSCLRIKKAIRTEAEFKQIIVCSVKWENIDHLTESGRVSTYRQVTNEKKIPSMRL